MPPFKIHSSSVRSNRPSVRRSTHPFVRCSLVFEGRAWCSLDANFLIHPNPRTTTGHECPPPTDGDERPPSPPLKRQQATVTHYQPALTTIQISTTGLARTGLELRPPPNAAGPHPDPMSPRCPTLQMGSDVFPADAGWDSTPDGMLCVAEAEPSIQFAHHTSHPIFISPANKFFSIYGNFGDLSEK
ncbi:uncharacterized protein LACBIDRAFT_332570 [Laccaria bicolor S238N-H82]|uniref:Predicted protein n=1 Tax=Laccaria bicolor (strain S238N-H82 / ATCC MYA-4686) TaxID=486041 RepID=B0DT62_LACBS|nr:uncharacterized protein LACBIDRAFT_332570 [Laccaria bicolor S238N-H82]EDR02220.1 predicted protein [Laccaria bicolor S238N-H82]|eukprot:XP_001887165.1 predicted protein [Laccaria bicolor S238N-H82]